jgi:ferredoxin
MNTAICYFSATGNSLSVANDLSVELGNTAVVPVTRALKTGVNVSYDSLGIVYPVYMFGLPLIIAEFLKSSAIKPGSYVFSVATYGGLPGRPHSLSRNILKKRGIELACGFSVLMPGNYTPMYGAIAKQRQEKMFAQEKSRVKEIAQLVRQKKRGIVEEQPILLNTLLYSLLYKGGSAMIPLSAKGFWATDSCNECGKCALVCPVANIELRDGKPVWLEHCQHCMACLQWCPAEAIQYKKSTLGKKRYHHPQVTQEAIMRQR